MNSLKETNTTPNKISNVACIRETKGAFLHSAHKARGQRLIVS